MIRSALVALLAFTGCSDAESPHMDPPLPAGTAPRFKPPLTLLEGRRVGGTARFEAAATSVFSNDDLHMAERLRFTRFEARLGDGRARVTLKQPPSLFRGNSDAAEGSYSPASWWEYWLVVRVRAAEPGPFELRGCTDDGKCDEVTAEARFDASGRLVPTN